MIKLCVSVRSSRRHFQTQLIEPWLAAQLENWVFVLGWVVWCGAGWCAVPPQQQQQQHSVASRVLAGCATGAGLAGMPREYSAC